MSDAINFDALPSTTRYKVRAARRHYTHVYVRPGRNGTGYSVQATNGDPILCGKLEQDGWALVVGPTETPFREWPGWALVLG